MARQESMEEAFTRFIEDYEDDAGILTYEQAISEMVVKGEKSIVINFTHLYGFDMDMARSVLDDPESLAPIFGSVVRSKLRTRDPLFAESLNRVNVRFRSLPAETHLRKIGSDNISHLVMGPHLGRGRDRRRPESMARRAGHRARGSPAQRRCALLLQRRAGLYPPAARGGSRGLARGGDP